MAILVPTYVSVWNTKKAGNRINQAYGSYYLLNTNRISDMITLTGGQSVGFWFANDPDDPRDSPDRIECLGTVASMRIGHDTEPTSLMASLDLFPKNNTEGTPVTTMIPWSSIAYAYVTVRDYEDDVCRIVYYTNDWQRKEAVVNMSILNFYLAQTA